MCVTWTGSCVLKLTISVFRIVMSFVNLKDHLRNAGQLINYKIYRWSRCSPSFTANDIKLEARHYNNTSSGGHRGLHSLAIICGIPQISVTPAFYLSVQWTDQGLFPFCSPSLSYLSFSMRLHARGVLGVRYHKLKSRIGEGSGSFGCSLTSFLCSMTMGSLEHYRWIYSLK